MFKEYIEIIILLSCLVALIYFGLLYEKKADWEGVPVKSEPIQTTLKSNISIKYGKGFFIVPLADYKIKGIVVSTERYFFDSTSFISPIDICLVWKNMSVADVINGFKFKQQRRYVLYAPKNKKYWPLMEQEVKSCLSNNHCIPANKQIKKQLLKIKKFDLVTLKGQLVKVQKVGMQDWVSSLSRDDEGEWGKLGGCEIIYVKEVTIEKP